MKLGFIGLGNMGNNMAMNLLKTGHTLQVTDLRREAGANLEEAGAVWVDSAEQAVSGADFSFLSLPMPKDVEHVVLGDGGVLAGCQTGHTIVDMSTNAPTVVKSLAEQCRAKGVDFLDAPVSGGVRGARNASLAIMVGGTRRCTSAASHCSRPWARTSSTSAISGPAMWPSWSTTCWPSST